MVYHCYLSVSRDITGREGFPFPQKNYSQVIAIMICSQCNMPRRTCRSVNFLLGEKDQITKKKDQELMSAFAKTKESDSLSSRANVGISQISIPLAWNSDQHFKCKGESRTYSMFMVLQTKSKVVDSRLVTNIDRTMTDVVFPESFFFDGEPDDFCVEFTLYAARTDQVLSDAESSFRTKITRSLGRKFGTNVKMQLFAIDPWKVGPPPDSALGSTHFNMLARAYLALTDASSECKVHDLKLSAFADLSGPPLYGHILCRMVVQPRSVIYPIAEGILNVKPMVGGRLLRNVRTRLQAGNLICFMNSDIHQCPTAEETLLIVPITSSSKVISTSHTNTILLSTENTSEVEGCDVYIITETEKAMNAWKRAIKQQINDCGIWGEFAFTPTKLTCEKSDPLKETLSRVTGNNLYDKISITGTVSRGIVIGPSPSLSYCPRELSPLRSANSRTAPVKRPKQRANVLELFQPSSNRSEFHKCVIDLDVDDGYGKIKSEQAPLNNPPLTQTFHGGMIQHCSSLSRQAQVENFYSPHTNGARTSVSAHNYSTENSGDKKSWSRSFGALIGKKNASSMEVTRL